MCCCHWSKKYFTFILYVLGAFLAIVGSVTLLFGLRNKIKTRWISDAYRSDSSGNLKSGFDSFVNGCIFISLMLIFIGVMVHALIRMKNNICTAFYTVGVCFTFIIIIAISSPAMLLWGLTDANV